MPHKLKIYERAKKCLEKYQERESTNIKRAEEAIRFRALEQWPEQIRRDRENPNQDGDARPCPVLDKTNQHVRQIVNEERQNRAAIKIRPVDDNADKDVAEVFTGIIRHIEDQSDAIEAYTTAGEQAIDGGYGYFRLVTEYSEVKDIDSLNASNFNQQDILVKRIPNRFSVATGVHQDPTGSDMMEAVVWEDMDKEAFRQKYPKAKEVSFQDGAEWSTDDSIRIAEYMWIETNPTKIYLLEDDQVVTELPKGVKAVKTRTLYNKTVKWAKITGAETLEEKDMVGSFIPVIKVIGNELIMPDGKVRLSGAIEAAMDPQRLHNYAHAGFIETVALAPKVPWIAEESQVEGYEGEFAAANKQGLALVRYKSAMDDSGRQLPRPDRVQPAGIPPGWQQMLANTEHGVEASMGSYGPTVGAQSQEKSGIALREQKDQGFVGNFHFPDNLARSIQHCGRIMLEWIPEYLDTEMVARILGEEGDTTMAFLNPDQDEAIMPRLDEMGEEIGSIYNLNVGKYDVSVSTGPSYTAKRQEAVENQIQLVGARPELMPLIGDIVLSNMDWPGADKMAERLKAMLPPQIQALEDQEGGKPVDPQAQAMQQHIAQGMQIINTRGQELEQQAQELQQQAQEGDVSKAQITSDARALKDQQAVFMAKVGEQKANLQLIGQKLIDQLENVTDPLKEQLNQQTTEVETGETDESGEPETIVVQDPAMQELISSVAQMTAESQAQMAETVSNALVQMAETFNQPRETVLQRDAEGNAIGSTSRQV